MPRPNIKMQPKAKNMKKSLKNLAIYCKSYWTIIVIALICAAVSAVLAVIGPNFISKLTDTINNGIIRGEDGFSILAVKLTWIWLKRLGLH